jgi:5-methyltetrahydrofolate--homocysteine methyltransferase
MNDKFDELSKALLELEEDHVYEKVDLMISEEVQPMQIINALIAGMDDVGKRFKGGDYFLSELVYSGEIFKQAMDKVRPLLGDGQYDLSRGKVIIGTVKDDIHDLGKNIVITMLECAGYKIIDLGVDVPPEKFADSVKSSGALLVGLSLLLTTAYDSLRDCVKAVKKSDPGGTVKIMIGGSVTSEALRQEVGADFYGADAAAAVDIAREVYI